MKPSVVRSVHYQRDGVCRAAIITNVREDDTVDLAVFESPSVRFYSGVPLDETGKHHQSWHWAERTE